MRPFRAIFGFLGGLARLIWRAVKGIYDRLSILLEGFLGPPLRALKRLLSAMRVRLDKVIQFLLRVWARLFKKAPKPPRDRRPTPGITGLPLTAAVIAVVIGYMTPWTDWIELSDHRFVAVVLSGFVATLLLLRALCRRSEPGRLVRGLIDVHQRAGLQRAERFCLLVGLLVIYVSWSELLLRPASGLLTFGFLVLNMSDDQARRLSDDFPAMEEVDVPESSGLFEDRMFHWRAEIRGELVEFAAPIRVDMTTLESMKTQNPVRPIDSHRPDFTPWVVDGTTSEVAQVAHTIRDQAENLGLTRLQEAIAALSFAQSFMYSLDEDSTGEAEYWRYPIETIAETTGDCEDTAILALAVCRWLGIDAVPLVTSDHAAYGLVVPCGTPDAIRIDDLCVLYAETTSTVTLGVLPDDVDVADLRRCEPRVGSPRVLAT